MEYETETEASSMVSVTQVLNDRAKPNDWTYLGRRRYFFSNAGQTRPLFAHVFVLFLTQSQMEFKIWQIIEKAWMVCLVLEPQDHWIVGANESTELPLRRYI